MDENDDSINDILLGIGSGAAQSESPFVRSFGASLATTVGSKERRKEQRQKKADEIEAEQRREESINRLADAASSRQIDTELEMRRRMAEMYKGKKAVTVSRGATDWARQFMDMFGKFVPKTPAKPKTQLGSERTSVPEPPPSPMRRPPGVEPMPFDEPSSGSSSSTNGARNTYLDNKGMRRYTDTGQPFGTF